MGVMGRWPAYVCDEAVVTGSHAGPGEDASPVTSKTIYLAARYGRRPALVYYRKSLQALGYNVQSRWVDGEHETIDATATPEQMRSFANDDLSDINDSDTMISFTDGPDVDGWVRGGRHVEFGYAYSAMMRIIIVGPRENTFHYLADVEQFDTWAECWAMLHGEADNRSKSTT